TLFFRVHDSLAVVICWKEQFQFEFAPTELDLTGSLECGFRQTAAFYPTNHSNLVRRRLAERWVAIIWFVPVLLFHIPEYSRPAIIHWFLG
ncbi:uncharacterized protein APUU_40603A, partial [Aspergillus puulaauensis]